MHFLFLYILIVDIFLPPYHILFESYDDSGNYYKFLDSNKKL